MIEYRKFRPTQFDTAGLWLEDQQDWLVPGIVHDRDSDLLTESNWGVFKKMIEEADPDGEDYEAHTFNHWGPGWFEIMLVRPGSKCEEVAKQAEDAIANYPLLDEDDYSEKLHDAVYEYWGHCSLKERVEFCQEAEANVFAARRTDEIPERVYDRVRERVMQYE